MNIKIVLIFTTLLGLSIINSQIIQYDGYIETRKLFLFGPDNGFQFAQFKSTHNFLFERQFDNIPRVGLAVYTVDFEYSPDFSCRITAATNKTATAIQIRSSGSDANNRLYIMYIATDHEQMGIFVPQKLQTSDLSLPTRTKSSQNFDFNFKEEISKLANKYTDISVTVYLTGLSTTSQMTTNGFPTNRTSVSLKATHSSTRFYSIEVMIGEDFQFILLDWVECTVVYFIPDVLSNNRYQVNSGSVTLKGYGGTVQPVSQSVDLLPLQTNNKFQNLKFFYGISRIQCKDGNSITLLGVQKYYNSPQDNSIRLLLQMQTWKLTYMQISSFNYIQYKSLKCTQAGSNCPATCSSGLRPFYIIQNQCNYCHYSCLTCNVTNLDNFCDTCDASRKLNPGSNLCTCISSFYETYTNFTCASCFPCATCEKANSCLTCLEKDNMVLNTVTSECQCKARYYANLVNSSYVVAQPCLKCSDNCLHCLNGTFCLACSMSSYLSKGICILVCKQNQKYISSNRTCQIYDGNLFDQEGRLDFDWSYELGQNEMIIDVIFSQTDMAYYYVENGTGYTYQDYIKQINQGGSQAGAGSGSSFIWDDGIYSSGYMNSFQSNSASDSGSGAAGSNSGSGSGSGSASGSGSGSGSGSNSGYSYSSGSGSISIIDESALRGEYYGYGQTRFFQSIYENQTVSYKDQYGIPYGKYRVSTSQPVLNANYIDALSRNLVFKISGVIIPYTMEGVTNNRFTLRTRPTKTYINALGAIQIKNTALVRAGQTALQKNIVTKDINRFDFYTQQQLSTATNIGNSNRILVDILWGVCKYFLFVGFGWPFLPIMLALQYIMSFNYIHSSLPLNLDYFLASFRDFRNPSIFYKPFRDDFDASVVNHPNIYKSIPEFQEFDRGLDFMKNCWQFFFIPLLACALLFLLYLLNQLFRKCCRRDFCLISKFLVPRAPLLIAAYTLVQALPVSFFFFAQLKDTTFRHPLEPNMAYPTFNTAMAYVAFFLTCAIPILLLAWLYYHFNYGNRISKFSDANVFNRKFLNKIDNQSGRFSLARLQDPLWGGNTTKTGTYVFGIAIFALAIVFGFFLAFFIKDFAWQLAGIIFLTVIFLAFVVAASFFTSRVFKVFFIIIGILMLAYLLLHAGIGSNRAIGTYDQWNTGYLGIGILYALLITAILFTAYLLYRMFRQMYQNHKQFGCWIDIDKQNQIPVERKQVQRITEYKRDTNMRSTLYKNGVSNVNGMGQSNLQNNLIGSQFNYNTITSNVKKVLNQEEDNIYSEQKMAGRLYEYSQGNELDQLVLNKEDAYKKETTFVSRNRNMIFGFPDENGRMLLAKRPIYIDGENRIYDRNKQFIDYYYNLSKRTDQLSLKNQIIASQGVSNIFSQGQGRVKEQNSNSYKTITTRKQIFSINNQDFEKIGEEQDGKIKLKNMRTGQIKYFPLNNFKKTSESQLRYNQTSNILIPDNYDLQLKSQRLQLPTRPIVYQGYDPYSQDFKIINEKTKIIQRIPKNRYIAIMEENFNRRIYIGDDQFDYQGTDANGKVYLANNITKQPLVLTENQFERFRQQNLNSFYQNMDKQMAQSQQKPSILTFKGEKYESLGVDSQGMHRLINIRTKSPLSISDQEYRSAQDGLYGNKMASGSQNLLLLQSAVGIMKRGNSEPYKQPQIYLQSQKSQYYVFVQQDGNKIYIPKSKINPDLDIEQDEFGNLIQQGRIIVGKQEAKHTMAPVQRKTQTLITSTRQVFPETDTEQQLQLVQKRPIQEMNQKQAINPESYYKILGIPGQKLNQFVYKQRDVYLTERNVKGKDVMQKIQKIQSKYPTLVLLVKNQSDETDEFWVN